MPSYPEPTWGEPYRVCQPVLSDRTPRTPSVVSAGVLSLLRNHFGLCRLVIEPAMTYEPATTGNSPALVVQPGNMRVGTLSIGDRITPHVDADGVYRGKDRILGTEGELRVIILAPIPLQALMLSEEMAMFIVAFADEYANALSLSKLSLAGIDPPVTRGDDAGGSVREYMASVTLRWSAVQSWTISTRGPVLRRGGLSL